MWDTDHFAVCFFLSPMQRMESGNICNKQQIYCEIVRKNIKKLTLFLRKAIIKIAFVSEIRSMVQAEGTLWRDIWRQETV